MDISLVLAITIEGRRKIGSGLYYDEKRGTVDITSDEDSLFFFFFFFGHVANLTLAALKVPWNKSLT